MSKTYSTYKGSAISPRKKFGLLPSEAESLKVFVEKRGNLSRIKEKTGIHQNTVLNGLESGLFEYRIALLLKDFIKNIING